MTISKPVFDRLGLLLWIVAFLVTVTLAQMSLDHRSVVFVYRNGSEAFVAQQPLYHVHLAMGYLYAPAFAALYSPLLMLGHHFGDLVWRTICFGVITLAVVRQVRKLGGHDLTWLLSFGLVMSLPMALGAIRNGQATILLTGACWLLTLSALEGRRAETFLWTSVAIIAKPTAIVMVLLVAALRPRLIPVIVLALLVVLIIPYAFAPVGYVNDQYHDFFQMLTAMAVDRTGPFEPADFTSVFASFGYPLPEREATIVRVIAALMALSAVLWYDRRMERGTAVLAIFVVGAFYMCVFNPRVEPNTYAMIAIPSGVAIALLWRQEQGGALRLVLMALLVLSGMTGIFRPIHEFLSPWLRPIVVSFISCTLIWWFWARARVKVHDAGSVAHG
ncbi:glycosyltransferase 87 family protein [Mesorhizobium sp. PAMC28654]|uniref:glycosyltransferase 87 family protein n=1 Tax=Mesorhizobium sp. PAMC28654 TaxID=2880934 RepID=UPI001D09C5C1|nr:glycosyltransferase 87 family protein [Mesorhizobium sp. PAMC28654]UDL88435.1 glycosyltransferase 87 family protein [Mesorhizobium sp. PAMC28654]